MFGTGTDSRLRGWQVRGMALCVACAGRVLAAPGRVYRGDPDHRPQPLHRRGEGPDLPECAVCGAALDEVRAA